MSDDATRLYGSEIRAHDRQPRNEGALEDATHTARSTNPLCGDRVTLYLRIIDGCVEGARFEARGCAIARASASMLTEAIEGCALDAARDLGRRLEAALEGSPVSLGPLEPLRPVGGFPARVRCATLAWETFAKAVPS